MIMPYLHFTSLFLLKTDVVDKDDADPKYGKPSKVPSYGRYRR